MKMLIGIIVVVALISAYAIVRRNRERENVRPDQLNKRVATSDSQFHAVSLQFASNACDAAKNMKGRRFLSNAAPRIPLTECDAAECRCKFVHHKDRRSREDRRSPFGKGIGGGETGEHRIEQRQSGERRNDTADDEF